MRKVYEARGEWAIQESGRHELMQYLKDFKYGNALIVWHIATTVRYNIIEGDVDKAGEMKRYSKILSDYMMYLLVKQPKLMSPVAGISHMRYKDTCEKAKALGRKSGAPTMREFCRLILEEHATITELLLVERHCTHLVLRDACMLVRVLPGKSNKWVIVFKVWSELLSYAAGHCKADSHARILSEGVEFIAFVWMLMAHYGIGAQFPVN